ncbi:MAG: tetratricopeptide repeat protein, partial [Cyanobacteria bacterium J06560_2]
MKFSNGKRVDLTTARQPDVVTVEWQSVLLESMPLPVEGNLPSEQSIPDAVELVVSEMSPQHVMPPHTTTMRDDLTGVIAHVPTNGPPSIRLQGVGTSSPNAYALAVHNPANSAGAGFGHAPSRQISAQTGGAIVSQMGVDYGGTVPLGSSLVVASDSLSDVVKIYLQQAEAYCEEKQWDKALHACQEILKVAPANADAYKFLGKILQQQGQPTDAMGFYAKALTLRPNFPEVYSNMGSLYAKKGKWDEAIDYYKKAIARDPNFAPAYLNMARVWKRLNRAENEISCLTTAYQLQPDLATAQDHCRLAQSLEAKGDKESAVRFYQQAVERDPQLVVAYQRLADLLEDCGDWQGAAVCYRKVLALSSQSENGQSGNVQSGNVQSSGVQSGGVQSGGVQSAPPQPQPPRAVTAASDLSNVKKLSPENQQIIQKLLQASSTHQFVAPPPSAGGNALPAQSSTAPSVTPPLPTPAPTVPPAEMAQRYASVQDWPNAIKCIQQALAHEPRSALLHRSLATLYERINESELAAKTWYSAFVLEPSWPTAQQCLTLGQRLSWFGNIEAAMRCFKQAIQAQSDFAPAYEALAQLLRSQGHVQAADALIAQRSFQQKSNLGADLRPETNGAGAAAATPPSFTTASLPTNLSNHSIGRGEVAADLAADDMSLTA